MPVSSVGVALGVIRIGTGVYEAAAINHSAPALVGAAIGPYLMFAIRVAGQWAKVAVLRLGRYVGLRGPACST